MLFLLSAFFIKRALNSYEEYTLCGRTLTIWYIIFTYLGTWIGGGTIIGLAGTAYENGAHRYWLFASSCIVSFIFAFIFITRIRKLRVNSIGDMFAMRYPKNKEIIRIPVAIGIMIRNVTMTGMQFAALSYLLVYSFHINKNLAVLATFIVITAYTSISGLWSVVATDVFQGILQTIGLFLIIFFCIRSAGGISETMSFFSSPSQQGYINILGSDTSSWAKDILVYIFSFGLFFIMGDQCDWERIGSAKTDKAAFWGFLIPITIMLILLLSPTYIGVLQRALNLDDSGSNFIIYSFLLHMVRPAFSAFIIVTLFASIMSSADSYMFATGVIFSNDIIKRFFNKNAGDKELIFWTRWGVIASGAVGFAFAVNINDIVSLWITGMAIPVITLIPAYLFAWFSKKVNTTGVLAGIIFGAVYCGVILISGHNMEFIYIMAGTAANALITYFVSVFKGEKDENAADIGYYSEIFKSVKKIPR